MSQKKQSQQSPKSPETEQIHALGIVGIGAEARKALDRYMEWVMSLKGRIAFRGQADAEQEVKSGAYRRVEEKAKEQPYFAHLIFVGYLHERINETHMRFSEHREKEPLEIMAQLQHYGAATGLIDFTENALIALWFACKDQSEKAGKVFAVRLDDHEKIQEIKNRENLKGAIDTFFGENESRDKLWAWKPSDFSNRMITQQSLFIFGPPSIEQKFFAVPPYEIPSKEKINLMTALKKSGISEAFIFSDFSGFSSANAHEKDYDFYQAKTYYDEKIDRLDDDNTAMGGRAIKKKALFYSQRAKFNVALRLFDNAEKDFLEAVKAAPEYSVAHCDLGIFLSVVGRLKDALEPLNKAIELDPENVTAYIVQGLVLYDLDDYKEALASLDKATELDPENSVAYNIHGLCLIRLNLREKALESFNKSIELDPKHAMAYYNRGTLLNDLGHHNEALASLDKAIELDPEYSEAHHNRGCSLAELGRNEKACDAWKEAKRLAENSNNEKVLNEASRKLEEFCK